VDNAEELYEEVRRMFSRRSGDAALFDQPEELADQCIRAAKAITMVSLNKKLKKKLTRCDVDELPLTPVMCMANLWGLHIYLKQLARKGGYIPPEIYTDKGKVEKAGDYALETLIKPHNIGPEAEAVMDEFTKPMMKKYTEAGVKIEKNEYILLLEYNLRWGYEFGRGVFAG